MCLVTRALSPSPLSLSLSIYLSLSLSLFRSLSLSFFLFVGLSLCRYVLMWVFKSLDFVTDYQLLINMLRYSTQTINCDALNSIFLPNGVINPDTGPVGLLGLRIERICTLGL